MDKIKEKLAEIAPFILSVCLGVAIYYISEYPDDCFKIILAIVERF